MKLKFLFLVLCFNYNALLVKAPLIYDFGVNKDFGKWSIINDGVMGGLSSAKANLEENALHFAGDVSLKNNGGFVSLRSALGSYDLSDYEFCEIRFKSDTRRQFEILIEKDTPYYLPKFRTKFGGDSQEWTTLTIPLKALEISRMGNTIQKGVDPKVLNNIRRIGIILSDKQEGSFQLWIDYIKFY